MKLISKIVGVTLGLAMAVGVGVGVAANNRKAIGLDADEQSVTFNLTSSDLRTSISTTLIKYESGSVYASLIKGSGTNVNNYCPGGSTNNTTQTRVYNGNSIDFGVGDGYVITRIDITATGTDYFGGLNNGSNYSPSATITTNGNTATASFAEASQSQTVTANTTATGRLTAIKIYYDEPSANASLSLDKSEIIVGVGYPSTFTVTTANLTSNFGIEGGDSNYFTTSYTPSASDGPHTVTLTGVAITASPIVLTVSATGVVSQTISVSVVEPVIYEKVNAASSIRVGKQIIIGTTDGSFVMGQYSSGNNCPALANVPNNNGNLVSTALPEGYALLTIGGESGAWTLTDQSDAVYYGTSNQNYLKSGADDTWSISISAGVATIASAASSRTIKKNSSSPLFATYASGQADISIYMVPSADPEIEVSITGSTSLGVGETAELSVTKLNGASGTVNWATSNASILSISDSTGDSITVTAESTLGNATITTSLAGCDSVVTAFIVRKGSSSQPYTVAEAMAAIDGTDPLAKANVYVSGIISQIDTLNPDNSITYWISDDGTTTNQLQVYKGKGLNGNVFEAVDDIEAGATVKVNGTLKKYDDIYEFNSGSQLITYSAPTITTRINAFLSSASSVATINGTEHKSSDVAPESIVFADLSLENGVRYTDPFDGGHFTITFAGGSNDGKYYDGGTAIRTYAGGSFTIESTEDISKIELTWDSPDDNKPSSNNVVDCGSYNKDTFIWTGSSHSVTFTRPSGSGHWRLQALEVSYGSFESVDQIKLRFGAKIPVETWEAINALEDVEITGYGVALFRTSEALKNSAPSVRSLVEAEPDKANPEHVAINVRNSNVPPAAEDGYHTFVSKVNITKPANYDMYFCAQAFIVVNGEDYYFVGEEMRDSVRTLAANNNGTNLSNEALASLLS